MRSVSTPYLEGQIFVSCRIFSIIGRILRRLRSVVLLRLSVRLLRCLLRLLSIRLTIAFLFLLLTIPDRNVVKGANQAFDRFACRAVLFLIKPGGQIACNADERAFFRFAEGTYKEVARTAGNVGRCLILSLALVDSQIEDNKLFAVFVCFDFGIFRQSPNCSEL